MRKKEGNMHKVKRIHFVGIKGVGMTPLAIIAKEAGIDVSGSDVEEKFITDVALERKHIKPLVGFLPEHISQGIDLVITTGAHNGYDNPEVVRALDLGIPVMSAGEAVGEFMDGEILGKKLIGISVAGSHGKTTTTAMLTTILKENNMDPSYLIGTGSFGDKLPGHFGKGNYFIAEADEYATEPKHDRKARFLWQRPQYAIFTNIEHDHPDIYPTLENVIAVFKQFASKMPRNGVLVGNGDDERVFAILKDAPCKTISYGFSPKNTYVITHVHVSGEQTFFRVSQKDVDLGEFRISVTGEHNALNALGATLLALEAGVPLERIKAVLGKFKGSKRRLEYKGQLVSGAHVFDDYAHHPTEIRSTLKSLRARYPQSTLIAIFQPHTFSRTKTLLQDFVTAFDQAHNVIITDIFPSAREAIDPTISSKLLVDKLTLRHPAALYIAKPEQVAELLSKERLKDNVTIVFMGAGDIYKSIDLLPFN